MTRARLLFTLGAICMVAQAAMPAPAPAQERRIMSPAGSSATQIGGTYYDPVRGFVNDDWVEIRFGRPLRRGRDIFGLDDYAEHLNDGAPVWRAGANETTRLITDVPLVFGDTTVEPGEYTVFIDLTATPWTFILSTWPAQVRYDEANREALFGAFEYTPDRDVLRQPMTVETLAHAFDQLSWQFLDVTEEGGTLGMFWDTSLASVPFTLVK
ncbi:MAG: hypothetical protein CL477_11570 [Acidobacteria bacterium]|jgi:hypothetical protein|nr:hypothetical protein [Acidobacteriota bacterium]MDP7692016.1 DUF2911 domain-containing protein [Vicinamibacterales bacterium]HJN44501.1 DUF2911 domain-containing protein [Vicinamibacterales bacterium]|tara:strand:+ start:1353 stop:1988 length:636 start_codon:yes stop_codon:yes gene_type:complete